MNKVIIFGLDHYNSLGLARVFGVNGIKPYGILKSCYDTHKKDFCYLSKYWTKVIYVDSEKQGIRCLIKNFSNEKERPVIIPSSDQAEEAIDHNYDILANNFIVPGIQNKGGAVLGLMNKMEQAQWAKDLGINVADTFKINLLEDYKIPELLFPCIVKPVMSSDGVKADIKKIENIESLKEYLCILKNKGYSRILIQNFIFKDYEAELFGCIPKYSDRIPFILTRHIREWPTVGGSVSCHQFISDEGLKLKAREILKRIKEYGYIGNIDIELFIVNGEIYLNEVNFRNSGDIFACFHSEMYYPYYWYLDVIGKDISRLNINYKCDKYAMNETTDFRHVVNGSIAIWDWLKYLNNTADCALWFRGDLKPALKRYSYYFMNYGRKVVENIMNRSKKRKDRWGVLPKL